MHLYKLPLHFWKPKMLTDIGEGVGELLDHELTPAAARIQVMVNGLEPLVKETIVEFDDGSEALVTLDYKRLKSYCTHCHRLTHDKKDCPGLQQDKDPSIEQTSSRHQKDRPANNTSHSFHQRDNRDHSKSHYHPYKRSERPSADRSSATRAPRDYVSKQRISTPYKKVPETKAYSFARESSRHDDYFNGDSIREPRNYDNNLEAPTRNTLVQSLQWREKTPTQDNPIFETSQSSRVRRPPLERQRSTL